MTAEAADRRGLRSRLFEIREDDAVGEEEEEATGAEAEVDPEGTRSVLGVVSFLTLTSEGKKSSSLA